MKRKSHNGMGIFFFFTNVCANVIKRTEFFPTEMMRIIQLISCSNVQRGL